MLGNIKFIGELGKLELLHEGILHKCIQQLLGSKRRGRGHLVGDMAEDLECLCQIMRTVGRRLDTDKARAWMDQYFERMKAYMVNPDLPSRIRFMLQDTVELRENRWVPRKILRENGPKTIQQVRHEAAREFGLNIPAPPSPGATPMIAPATMDLFGRPLNDGNVPRPGRMPPPDMFGPAPIPLSPPFMSGGLGIGTGPGTIHIDSFASSNFRRGGGNNPNFRGGGSNRGGFNPNHHNNRRQEDEQQQKFFPNDSNDLFEQNSSSQQHNNHNQQQQQRRDNRKDYNNEENGRTGRDGGGYNNYRNNNRDNNRGDNDRGYNNRENHYNPNFQKNNFQRGQNQQQQMVQKDIDKLPPRFRKQMQMQQQGSGSPNNQFLPSGNGAPEINGSSTPPMESSRSPSHTPPPPNMQQNSHQSIGNKSTNEEFNLRPGNLRHFTPTFRPNIPSMLPRSAQIPQQMQNRPDVRPPLVVLDPPAPVLTAPQVIPIKKVHSSDKLKDKAKDEQKPKGKTPSKAEIKEKMAQILDDYLDNGNTKEAVKALKDLKPPKDCCPEFVSNLILKNLDRSDSDRENVSVLLTEMKDCGLVDSDYTMEGFSCVFDKMKSLEVEVPLVKSHLAKLAAQTVASDLISLQELAEPMKYGTHYPLFLLCLQQLHKVKDKSWLLQTFNKSKINLQDMLPECDRKKERMMDILEDRGLSFLFPLLRIQTDLTKQLSQDPTPTALYKWIKDNVDSEVCKDHGFIKILFSSLLKYITCESTLQENGDKNNPDKASTDKEKELLSRYKGVMAHFLQDSIELQIVAIYAMQVFVHAQSFPKGMLLRLFMQMYDNEVIDEEAFLRWKEEVNDQYPGKGKALFQVNTWLTWLEQAESESSDGEEE